LVPMQGSAMTYVMGDLRRLSPFAFRIKNSDAKPTGFYELASFQILVLCPGAYLQSTVWWRTTMLTIVGMVTLRRLLGAWKE
jgi:hypothetical protein